MSQIHAHQSKALETKPLQHTHPKCVEVAAARCFHLNIALLTCEHAHCQHMLRRSGVKCWVCYAAISRNDMQVLSVRFNCISERILAVGYANGSTHIYDSRKQRAVMEFADATSPRRTAGIAWSPAAQTHLVLASDDDRSPTLQFWDLRKNDATQLEYVGHSRGVTDVAWCAAEPGVMVSSGKDAQTLIWDTHSGDRLGSLDAYDPGPAIQVSAALRCSACHPDSCKLHYSTTVMAPHLQCTVRDRATVDVCRMQQCPAGCMEPDQPRHIPHLPGRQGSAHRKLRRHGMQRRDGCRPCHWRRDLPPSVAPVASCTSVDAPQVLCTLWLGRQACNLQTAGGP